MPTQTSDIYDTSGNPGLSFTAINQTWTISGCYVSATLDHAVESTFAGSRLINNGTLTSYATVTFGYGYGVLFTGANSFISNEVGRYIIGSDGIDVDGPDSTVVNKGFVVGHRSTAVFFTGNAEGYLLVNRGDLFGRANGVANLGMAADTGAIRNFAEIRSDDSGLYFNNLATFRALVTNAAGAVIKGGDEAILSTGGAFTLTNRGTLIGRIDANGADARDVVINLSKIKGPVALGPGNDLFNGAGGTSGPLFGEAGADTLRGGAGLDKLNGGLGNDVLTGRGGPDWFIFDQPIFPVANIDRVTDFLPNVDKLFLDDDVFIGIGLPGPLAAGRFHVGGGFTTPAQRINYNPANGHLTYDANGSNPGGNGPIHFATLAKNLLLDHFDVIVSA